MVSRIRPFATESREPRQARKGATVTVPSGAGDRRVRAATQFKMVWSKVRLMSYTVLARKWRPRSFEEMVGQGHVLQALTHALDQSRLHHAYLFTGTRGVGKTTVARIFAKALNCEQGVSSHPCGECSACREIDSGRFVDLIEVDAASRTGVDDTRELLDNVAYAPVKARYKVYLIDEVHMFSKSSFNALLKTLEEPPEHVKFLLATTDPQKLPVTVLSRCLQFNLRALPLPQIRDYLADVLGREGVEFAPEAPMLVAEAAGGSMRDALSLLDQAIAFGGGRLAVDSVTQMLGLSDHGLIRAMVEALAAGDAAALFARVEQALDNAVDPGALLTQLTEAIHQLAMRQFVAGPAESSDDVDPWATLAAQVDPQTVQLWYQIAGTGRRDLGWAPNARVGLEMTLLRLLAFQPRTEGMPAAVPPAPAARPVAPSTPQVSKPASAAPEATAPVADSPVSESPGAQTATVDESPVDEQMDPPPWDEPAVAPVPQDEPVGMPMPEPEPPMASSAPEAISPDEAPVADQAPAVDPYEPLALNAENAAAIWQRIVPQIRQPARSLADRCRLRVDEHGPVLVVDPSFANLMNVSGKTRLQNALEVHMDVRGLRFEIEAQTGDESTDQTPAQIREQNEAEQYAADRESVLTHPAAQVLQERAGAELIESSIRPQGSA